LYIIVQFPEANPEAALAANFLDFVLVDVDSNWFKPFIFLGKIAIFLSVGCFDLCSLVASEYTALGRNALEYRNAAQCPNQLRVSLSDNRVRIAIALNIAYAFFTPTI
jgi:hypothetical protein